MRVEHGPAAFDPTRRYRYTLKRIWAAERRNVAWIGLNPSTADERQLDPTLRRVLGYSQAWGYGSFTMLNLFAYRATDPMQMRRAFDPIGPDNNDHIVHEIHVASAVIACWGSHGDFLSRGAEVKEMIQREGIPLYYLSLTKAGNPGHPLYLRKDLLPVEWV